jgi:hypothetical protein
MCFLVDRLFLTLNDNIFVWNVRLLPAMEGAQRPDV